MNDIERANERASVRAFLGERGYFVEVGAHHPTSDWSQTWHLEQAGWKGILVEPLQQLYDLIVRERPAAIAVRAACTSADKVGQLTLQTPDRRRSAHGAGGHRNRHR